MFPKNQDQWELNEEGTLYQGTGVQRESRDLKHGFSVVHIDPWGWIKFWSVDYKHRGL